MAKKRLFEGFSKSVVSGLRNFFSRTTEVKAKDIQKSATPSIDQAGANFNLVSQFGHNALADHLRIDSDLHNRYAEYEEMDEFPELSCGFDIFADDTTCPNLDKEQAIWVESKDESVSKDLNNMMHKTLLVEDDIWGVSRTLCKYGNGFGEALVSEAGVIGINYLPPPTVRRVEDQRGRLLGYIQDIQGEFNISLDEFYELAAQQKDGNPKDHIPGQKTVFEDWEIIHWRLRGKHLRSVYGYSVMEASRSVWKRLALLEDAMLIYKLERAPSRFAFYVDVGEMDLRRGMAHVNRVKNQYARKKFVNNQGKFDMRANFLGMDEDFFVPVRGGKRSTEIDILQGPDYSETETMEYFRDKLVSSTKIPKAYYGYGGEPMTQMLSSTDIRFARAAMRVQRELRSGYRKVCRVHIIARGGDPRAYEYDVRMNVPSVILELARMEVLNSTVSLATQMGEFVSTKWVLVNLFKFTEEEAVRVMDEQKQQRLDQGKIDAQINKMLEHIKGASGEDKERYIIETRTLEQRLDRLMKKNIDAWKVEFERGREKDFRRWDAKFEQFARNNSSSSAYKNLKRLQPFMSDLKKSMRSLQPNDLM